MNNYLPLFNTIHPRVTGFTFFVNLMRNHGIIDAVYDLTIGYIGNIPQTELAIFTGFPKECHVHLKRYDIKDLPSDENDLGEWLREKWYEKDNRLSAFYKNQKFETDGEPQHRSALYAPQTLQMFTVTVVVIWMVWLFVTLYFFMNNSLWFWYTIGCWVALQIISHLGGLDLWEMNYWEKYTAVLR